MSRTRAACLASIDAAARVCEMDRERYSSSENPGRYSMALPGGNNFWSVERFRSKKYDRLFAGSDRDFGLYILRHTG